MTTNILLEIISNVNAKTRDLNLKFGKIFNINTTEFVRDIYNS